MKILLLQPYSNERVIGGDDVFKYEPLGLEYLAATLRGHHDVKIADLRVEKCWPQVLDEFEPDLVGSYCNTCNVPDVKGFLSDVKARSQDIWTVVGGHHPTHRPEDLITEGADFAVIGEGVPTLAELVAALERGDDVGGIAGLAYEKDGVVHHTAKRGLPKLDDFPLPARDLTSHVRHLYFDKVVAPLASIRSTLGCPYRCNFCSLWPYTDGHYLQREVDRIVDELKTINEKAIFFTDDEGFIDPTKMDLLATRIAEEGIDKEYFIYMRANTAVKNKPLIEKWRKIGFRYTLVGFEAFTDDELDRYKKDVKQHENAEALAFFRELGVVVQSMIIIRPDYTVEDFERVHRFIDELQIEIPIFTVLTPFPGAKVFDEMKDDIITDDWSFFDMMHPVVKTRLPLDQFYKELFRLPHTEFMKLFFDPASRPLADKLKGVRSTLKALRQARKANT